MVGILLNQFSFRPIKRTYLPSTVELKQFIARLSLISFVASPKLGFRIVTLLDMVHIKWINCQEGIWDKFERIQRRKIMKDIRVSTLKNIECSRTLPLNSPNPMPFISSSEYDGLDPSVNFANRSVKGADFSSWLFGLSYRI